MNHPCQIYINIKTYLRKVKIIKILVIIICKYFPIQNRKKYLDYNNAPTLRRIIVATIIFNNNPQIKYVKMNINRHFNKN